MTTQSIHRLAHLLITLTIYFISQLGSSHPFMQRCDVSIYTNITPMLIMYHKEMSSCVVKQQPLWPNNGDGQMLHTYLQQPNMKVRPHQQKPASQHQQYTTQASKGKVRTLTLDAVCLPPYSLHRLQDTCHNAHIKDKKTAPTTVQAKTYDPAPEAATDTLENPKQIAKRRTNKPAPAHRDEATKATRSKQPEAIEATRSLNQTTETPRSLSHLQTRDKNLSQRQVTWKTQHTSKENIQTREWTPATSRSTTQSHNRDKNLLHHIIHHRTKHIKTNPHQTDPKPYTNSPRDEGSLRSAEDDTGLSKIPANRGRHNTISRTRAFQQTLQASVPVTRNNPPHKHCTDYSIPSPKVAIWTSPKDSAVERRHLQPKASTGGSLYRRQ